MSRVGLCESTTSTTTHRRTTTTERNILGIHTGKLVVCNKIKYLYLAKLKDNKNITNDFDCWNLGKNALIGDGRIVTVTNLAANYESYSKIITDRYPKKEIMVSNDVANLNHNMMILQQQVQLQQQDNYEPPSNVLGHKVSQSITWE
jgi:hypothetical protein